MKILQDHVDELDGFLERTTEDLLIMRLDVHTRIQYLTLPFENLEIFDEMLSDRAFRLSIVAYNDQIEHSIDRFTQTITDSLKDLQKAKEAMSALWIFFKDLSNEGYFASERLEAFSDAMMENMEGWMVAISRLRRQGTALLKALSQLGWATTEMQRRVGVASRRDVVSRSSEAVLPRSALTQSSDHSFIRAPRLLSGTKLSKSDSSRKECLLFQKSLCHAIPFPGQGERPRNPSILIVVLQFETRPSLSETPSLLAVEYEEYSTEPDHAVPCLQKLALTLALTLVLTLARAKEHCFHPPESSNEGSPSHSSPNELLVRSSIFMIAPERHPNHHDPRVASPSNNFEPSAPPLIDHPWLNHSHRPPKLDKTPGTNSRAGRAGKP